jgi:hypothetical protein
MRYELTLLPTNFEISQKKNPSAFEFARPEHLLRSGSLSWQTVPGLDHGG